jgi:hypothetical protein
MAGADDQDVEHEEALSGVPRETLFAQAEASEQ